MRNISPLSSQKPIKDSREKTHDDDAHCVMVEYDIPMPEKSNTEIKRDLELFKANLVLILANEERIIQTPEFFYVRLHAIHFGSTLTGCTHIPLGVLLLLWREGHWRTACKECGGIVNIFQCGGSLLSGRNSYSGRCINCGRDAHGRLQSIGELAGPVLNISKSCRNRRKIIRTHSQRFDWAKGLVGEPVADEIIEPGVEAVDIETIISDLK